MNSLTTTILRRVDRYTLWAFNPHDSLALRRRGR